MGEVDASTIRKTQSYESEEGKTQNKSGVFWNETMNFLI